jgi:DNA-binding MarR family transcriptional regulator
MAAKLAHPKPLNDPSGDLVESLLNVSAFLLNKAGARVREHYEEALKPLGMHGRHLSLMVAIEEKGSLTQQQMSRCLCTDRSSMVQLVDDLEKLGLVERLPVPDDRRAHAVALTRKGREILPEARRLGEAVEKEFLSCLPAAQRKDLMEGLRQLVLNHFTPEKPKEAKS